jgi:hypothetical protein
MITYGLALSKQTLKRGSKQIELVVNDAAEIESGKTEKDGW